MKAPVNKIIPFSTVDGPGSRTAIFLQGCNINCRYCHNPETRNLCIGCGVCVKACPAGALSLLREAAFGRSAADHSTRKGRVAAAKVWYDPEKCVGCDTCIRVCRHGCSPRIRELTPEQVMDEIRKNQPFIRGITVSGGECTLYPDFLTELFGLCRAEGLGTLIDSNGTLHFADYPKLLEVSDGVMLDVKAWDEREHVKVTGAHNRLILQNAEELARTGKLYEVRTVVVPGLFDYEQTVRETTRLVSPYRDRGYIRYKLIKYRPVGVRKEYAVYESPSDAVMEALAEIVKREGLDTVII